MNGLLLVDKPTDFTSHDVVAKLRGILRERRIGHAGTLDPMATGLLVVLVGRATRAASFAESQTKIYEAAIRFGITTDTQDITGNILEQIPAPVSSDELQNILPRFTGEIEQIPPMYSAIKKDGKKLYELARKGEEVERQPRIVTINSLKHAGQRGEDHLLTVECSKGTYIRTLCHDIGQALGVGAVMSDLRRVASGDFSIENAHSLEEIAAAAAQGTVEDLLLGVDSLFSQHPSLTVSPEIEKKCRCGNPFSVQAEDGHYRIYSQTGEFLLLGHAHKGMMTTVKSFFDV